MSVQRVDTVERDQHLKAIRTIAEELRTDFNIVKQTYEHELDRLQDGARLRDYLPLLAARNTRKLLHTGH